MSLYFFLFAYNFSGAIVSTLEAVELGSNLNIQIAFNSSENMFQKLDLYCICKYNDASEMDLTITSSC